MKLLTFEQARIIRNRVKAVKGNTYYRRWKDRKGSKPTTLVAKDRKITPGQRYGAVIVETKQRDYGLPRRVYDCHCACGVPLLLTATEIIGRGSANLGCCSPTCNSIPVGMQVWLNPEVAIRVQLAQASHVAPELLPIWPTEEGTDTVVAGIMEMLRSADVLRFGMWWLKDIAPTNIMQQNISPEMRPDPMLFPTNSLLCGLGGDLLPLDEWAGYLGLSEDFVLAMWLRHWGQDNLVTSINRRQ